jgi:hypothetical protein
VSAAGSGGLSVEIKRSSESPAEVSPQRKIVKNSDINSPTVSNGGVTTPTNTPKKDPAQLEALKQDRDARALNISLEAALLITLRREAAIEPIRFLDYDAEGTGLLTATNISEVLCSRLTDQNESAVTYLIGCYKRIVTKETSATAGIVTELAK